MVKSYPIDGKALKALLKLNGYNASQVSIDCGYGPNYFSVCINRQRMTPASALARALLCAGLTSIRDSVSEGGDER